MDPEVIAGMSLEQIDARLRELSVALPQKRTAVSGIFREAGDTTDLLKATALTGSVAERQTQLTGLMDEVETLASEETALKARGTELRTQQERLLRFRDANANALNAGVSPTGQIINGRAAVNALPTPQEQGTRMLIPPTAKRYGHLQHYHGAEAEQRAYADGMFILATIAGNKRAQQWCDDNGIETRSLIEGDNASGGFLVPEGFEATLINLKELHGVFRRNARIVPMQNERTVQPRLVSGMTAQPVGESESSTTQKPVFNRIALTAKEWQIISKISRSLSEDAAMNVADIVVGEMAPGFALAEDRCGFLGTGASEYHGIKGLGPTIDGLGTDADTAGLVVAAGNAWSEITRANILNMIGLLPQYASMIPGKVKWYCHNNFWANVMVEMVLALGGASSRDLVDGQKKMFFGYEVEITQVLPNVASNDSYPLFFGNLSMAAAFGDRRMTSIEYSKDAMDSFQNREIAIQMTERFDINVHDVGNCTSTAADKKPGPIIALKMLGS